MLDIRFLHSLAKHYASAGQGRRQLNEIANLAQHLAKQAIFTAQRGDLAAAEAQLASAEAQLKQGLSVCRRVEELNTLGSWRAALEEYTEAKLFVVYLTTGRVGKLSHPAITVEIYLGGLSDFVGELVRYAVKLATARKIVEVERLVELATLIVAAMSAMNLTGYLRSKFDQSKQHLRKLEDIRYDLSLRN
jgi:predicted translin family RNA/ssDNA-binding protein